MEIFLSWSGNKSKALAVILNDWFPAVIQAVKLYFTPEDISKGTRWATEISKKLDGCQMGIICLTSENYKAPWILFEAGALSKNLESSHVCPILFDIGSANVSGPLAQFQFTQFTKDDIKRLIKMINGELEDKSLADNILNDAFEMWWPTLEEKVKKELSKKEKNVPETIIRTDRELLEELLVLTRLNSRSSRSSIDQGALKDLMMNYELMIEIVINDGSERLIDPLRSFYKPISYLIEKFARDPGLEKQIIDVGKMINISQDIQKSTLKNLIKKKLGLGSPSYEEEQEEVST